MNIIYLMIPVSLLLAAVFFGAFLWSIRNGQMDDTETPAHRILDNDTKGIS